MGSKATNRNARWKKENYARVVIDVPVELKELWQREAKKRKLPLALFIRFCVGFTTGAWEPYKARAKDKHGRQIGASAYDWASDELGWRMNATSYRWMRIVKQSGVRLEDVITFYMCECLNKIPDFKSGRWLEKAEPDEVWDQVYDETDAAYTWEVKSMRVPAKWYDPNDEDEYESYFRPRYPEHAIDRHEASRERFGYVLPPVPLEPW